MEVEIFALCDAATISGGKLNILGAFHVIRATSAPFTHRPVAVAFRARFDKTEVGPKVFEIRFLDSAVNPINEPIAAKSTVPAPTRSDFTVVQIAIEARKLILPKFGEYRVDLAIDGLVVKSLPLFAREQAPPSVSS